MVSRDDLLILLEDGPHAARQLAEWLQADKREVLRALVALRTAGLVKTVSHSKDWALNEHQPKRGRPAQLDREGLAASVALLVPKGASRRTRDLMEATGLSRQAVLAACELLVSRGIFSMEGVARSTRWRHRHQAADLGVRAIPVAPRPLAPAPKPHLCVPNSTIPAVERVPASKGTSFWVGLDRDQLRDAIGHHEFAPSRVNPGTRELS